MQEKQFQNFKMSETNLVTIKFVDSTLLGPQKAKVYIIICILIIVYYSLPRKYLEFCTNVNISHLYTYIINYRFFQLVQSQKHVKCCLSYIPIENIWDLMEIEVE